MDTIYWRMNAMQGGANLHRGVNLLPGANLHPGANCAHEHGFKKDSRLKVPVSTPTVKPKIDNDSSYSVISNSFTCTI